MLFCYILILFYCVASLELRFHTEVSERSVKLCFKTFNSFLNPLSRTQYSFAFVQDFTHLLSDYFEQPLSRVIFVVHCMFKIVGGFLEGPEGVKWELGFAHFNKVPVSIA